jgi:uncharacterized MAPEG superfamily protein
MSTSLSTEFYWLVLTILMTALFWVPYILNRMLEQGIATALWDPHGVTDTRKAWARRMMQAHQNAIENLVLFAPLVILIQIMGLNSDASATACMVYFFARLLHYIVFTFAVPVLRIVTFLIAFAAQITLALQLLRA